MAQCSRCGAETLLFAGGTPICIDCDGARDDDEALTKILREKVEIARLRLDQANEHFKALARDAPPTIRQPDGALNIHQFGREYRDALKEFEEAMRKLNDFLLRGIVPPGMDWGKK